MALEVALMKKVEHIPEVVKLLDFLMERGHVLIVMELIPGAVDLRAHTSKYGELKMKDAKDVFLQVLTAVMSCHKAGVCHRDITMANILVVRNEGTGKMTAILRISVWAPSSATLRFLLIAMKKSAVWSLGLLLFRLACKKYPNDGDKREVKFSKDVSKSCQKPVRKCLASKSEKRLHPRGIQSHPWLKVKRTKGVKDFENSVLLPSTDSAEAQNLRLKFLPFFFLRLDLSSGHSHKQRR
ncbi:serine/threonine-protein kinase pim-1-like [Oratosquilla oratoria]|uniref:serine/threonine-protein kinase pim-1-like n=1 Tax=Oratosquilla oratoria TaxID=337810 RepID=UPI003F7661A0